jgi:putative ABC transport system permease protein
VKYFPLLWAGLWRKRARTIFTILSVIVAFLLFGLLQGVDAWLDNAVADSHVNRLYTTSRISFVEPLPSSYLQRIESVPGVDKVAYFHWFGAYYQDPKNNVFSYVVEPVRAFAVYPEWQVPADQLARMTRTRDGAIIGGALARQHGWKIGDHVPLKAPIWAKKDGSITYDFEIVGIFTSPEQPTNEMLFLLNYDYFDEARSFGQGQVGWYAFTIHDPAQAASISAAVDQMFRNSPYETRTQNEKEFAQARVKQIGDIGFMVNAIVGAVLFTLLFLTGNAMMQSVRERIPELAVLKTIGFTDGAVTALVVVESLLLCVVAAVAGLFLASALFPVIGTFIGGKVALPASVFVAGAITAIALALATALPPAWRANRLTVVNALAGR